MPYLFLAACLATGFVVSDPSRAQYISQDECGPDHDQCPKVIEEFAASYSSILDAELASDFSTMWDVDLASREGGGYRLVWEEKRHPDPFLARYRVWFDTGSGKISQPLCAGQSDQDVNICTLGRGANPEVFGDYAVWHGPDADSTTRKSIYWIRTADIESGACCRGGDACRCVCDPDLDDPECEDAARHVKQDALDPARNRKAAVSDGRVIVWWECDGNCSPTDVAVDLAGCVIPPEGQQTGCAAGEIFTVAAGPGAQRRPRVVVADIEGAYNPIARRSIVVFEECPDPDGQEGGLVADCNTDARTMGVYLNLDQPVGSVAGEPFPIFEAPGLAQHWPDVDGDLVVWDQEGTGVDSKEIWGCQAQRGTNRTLSFEDCGQHAFRISTPDALPAMHARPTVWSGTGVVGWSAQTDPNCPDNDILVARMQRNPEAANCPVATDSAGQAQASITRFTDAYARQRSPRIADDVLLWSDLRFIGCANCCDDAIGALFEQGDPDEWYNPEMTDLACRILGLSSGAVSFNLENDFPLGLRGELFASAQCTFQWPGGFPGACLPPNDILVETRTLSPGDNDIELDVECCVPMSMADIFVRIDFTSECGEQRTFWFDTLDCGY